MSPAGPPPITTMFICISLIVPCEVLSHLFSLVPRSPARSPSASRDPTRDTKAGQARAFGMHKKVWNITVANSAILYCNDG